MLLKFAFRSVLRNRRRTILTAIAIFFGSLVVVITQAWTWGMIDLMMSNYVRLQTGNLRVMDGEYFKQERFFPVDLLMYDAADLKSSIEKIEGVRTVEERIRFGILLGYGDNSAEAIGVGVDLFHSELDFRKKLLPGSRLEEDGLYIGEGLARTLGVTTNTELLIATTTSEGGLNGIKLPVKGIFRYGITVYDDAYFYIGLKDAKRLLKMAPEDSTELYVFTKNAREVPRVQKQIEKILPEGTVALNMEQQLGDMYTMFRLAKVIGFFMEALILFFASFVIINTMMMAIYERLHEIGTLKALGMTDRDLFRNFTLEGAIIGAMGGIAGIIIANIIVIYVGKVGIDMSVMMKNVDFPFDYILRPKLRLADIAISLGLSLLMPTLAAMFPARRARRLTASEALRK